MRLYAESAPTAQDFLPRSYGTFQRQHASLDLLPASMRRVPQGALPTNPDLRLAWGRASRGASPSKAGLSTPTSRSLLKFISALHLHRSARQTSSVSSQGISTIGSAVRRCILFETLRHWNIETSTPSWGKTWKTGCSTTGTSRI